MPEIKTISCHILLLILLSLMLMTVLPACAEMPDTREASSQALMTFREYTDQCGDTWFLTGKKEYSVQAMMVSKETFFHNDLEVADYSVTDDGITVILKGSYGEMWASKLSKVISTYTKPEAWTV